MTNLPRHLVLAIAGTFLLLGTFSNAQSQPQPAQQAEIDKALIDAAENYWHYGKIAQYPLQVAEGQKVLQFKDKPVMVLRAFEQVSQQHKDNLDQWLLRWQGVDGSREVTTQIINVLSQGHSERRSDPNNIQQNIERLSINERAYQLAIARLRDSGELAVPMMVDYLRDPNRRQHHIAVARGLRDMGRVVLNPLLAATEMKDDGTLTVVVSVLGDVGYDVAVPYLSRLAQSNETPAAARTEAQQVLVRMGVANPGDLKPANEFYALAEEAYYDNAAVTADSRRTDAFVWYWNEQSGLQRKSVAQPIFNEIMAMRAAEYALKVDPSKDEAISLWLAADYKREAELPEGKTDPTRLENQPSAHYYGVAAGSKYLNSALARALRDRNGAVALKSVKSLQEIAGQSNLFADNSQQPLIDAMSYPDRRVRFESAFALAAALPQKSFLGQDRVVPLLAEAVSQTGGTPTVLVVMPEATLNSTVQNLKDNGYNSLGGPNAEAAVSASMTLPSIDVILISADLPAGEVDQLFAAAGQTARLQGAAKLIITKTPSSPYAPRAVTDTLVNITQATEGASLVEAIEKARQRSGALPINKDMATDYALRSAHLLRDLAISRGQVLDLSVAQPTLLAALGDERPEVVMSIGEVAAQLNTKEAQGALLSHASDAKTAQDVKISLYKSLATSAKFHGNLLDVGQIETIQKAVNTQPELDVRAAAAEARGALNLPADQAKTLIVEQSRV